MPGHDRHAGALRGRARRGLAAHQRDRLGRGADEGQPRIAARRRANVFVLGEEAVAGMHGVGAGAPRRVDDAVDAQIALARRARPDGDASSAIRTCSAVRSHSE